MEESMLIVCSYCETPSAYGWCQQAGMGGEITGIVFSNFQRTWQCLECGLTHKLSKDFYEEQITFSPKRFVDVKEIRLEKEIREKNHLPKFARDFVEFWEANFHYLLFAAVAPGVCSLIFTIVAMGFDLHFPRVFNKFFLFFITIIPIFMGANLVVWIVPKAFLAIYKFRKLRE